MKTSSRSIRCSLLVFAITVLAACDRKAQETASNPGRKQLSKTKNTVLPNEEDVTAMATITAPDYEVKIYGAFAFVPEDHGTGLISPERGNHFVVLDMSVENTSGNKVVDMGKILLLAKVADDKGNVYPRNELAVEAFELEYPYEYHRSQYRRIKGKIEPGKYHRTTAYGFEAPEKVKNFVITLDEDGNVFKKPKVLEANFSIE